MSATQSGTANAPLVRGVINAIRHGVPYTDGNITIPAAASNDDTGRALILAALVTAHTSGLITAVLAQQLLQDLANVCGLSLASVTQEFAAANTGRVREKATDDGIALIFAEKAQSLLRFDHDRGKWFVYTGDHWAQDNTQRAFCYARNLTRNLSRRDPDMAPLRKIRTASDVEKAARADRRLAVESSVWDTDDWLLGVPGGVVDLRTGSLLPPDRGQLMTKRTLVAPADPGTPHPRWSAFLHEAAGGDADLIGFLQKVAGYCLTGDVTEEKFFFVWGDGGNGKGVFLRTIATIMHDYAMAAGMATFMRSKYDQHTTDLARLQGARVVTASETEEGRTWAIERIKEMTGNERPITARFLHRDNIEFRPKFKLIFVGNQKPKLSSVDNAITRRLNLIPFTNKPATINPYLKEQLVAEYPAILRWMIDGCLAWQRDGLKQPAIVRQATQEYLQDEDKFGNWVRECLVLDPTAKTANVDLFGSWTAWCEVNNEYPGANRGFVDRVLRELPTCRRGNRTERGEMVLGVARRSGAPSSGPDTRSEALKTLQGKLQFAEWFVGKDVAKGETGELAATVDLLNRLAAKTLTAVENDLPGIQQQFEEALARIPKEVLEALDKAWTEANEAAARHATGERP